MNTSTLRIIFAGTPEFSVPSLQALIASQHDVVAVLTATDKPAGRGQKLQASPIKQCAEAHQLPVLQPKHLRDDSTHEQLRAFDADVMIVIAYGQILPQKILDLPRYGCINVHASLLPRWRGAAPIHRAVLAGDDESGVCVMQMEAGLDTGPVLLTESCPLSVDESTQSLHDKLATLGSDALLTVLNNIEHYQAHAQIQDDSQASYAHKITKSEGLIHWQHSAHAIERQLRGCTPWPGCYTFLNQQRIRIHQACILPNAVHTAQPGEIIQASRGIDVATGDGVLRLLKLQLAGAKALDVATLLNAKQTLFLPGQCFSDSENRT